MGAAALSALAVYPTSAQTSVGLAGSIHSSLLTEKFDFKFTQKEEIITDENGEEDVAIYSGSAFEVMVTAKLKSRAGTYGQAAPGASNFAASTLPWNSTTFTQGFSTVTGSGVYYIMKDVNRTNTKATLDDFTFSLKAFGWKAATTFN